MVRTGFIHIHEVDFFFFSHALYCDLVDFTCQSLSGSQGCAWVMELSVSPFIKLHNSDVTP